MIYRQQWLIAGLLILVLVLILGLLKRFPPAEYIDNVYLNELVRKSGWFGTVGFYAVGALVTAVGFPRQLVAFISGYIFGIVAGTLLSLAAAITGCFLCYSCSRRWLRKFVQHRFASTVAMLDRFIANDAFLKIIILRLQPFGTNLATNLAAGVSAIPTRVFIGSSLLGYVPQMLVFALMGSGVRVNSSTQTGVSLCLFVLSVVIGLYLYKTRRPA